MTNTRLRLKVNGRDYSLAVPGSEVLSTTLRDRLGLLATKVACGRGECGACTVLVEGRPQLACIALTGRVRSVWTLEGLQGDTEALRRRFAERRGYQCGFCTPGQIVAALACVRESCSVDVRRAADAMSGNVCRCTGYRQLLGAVVDSVEEQSDMEPGRYPGRANAAGTES